MNEKTRKIAIEYGTIAAVYMFLINAIANRIMILQDHSTMIISGILWFTSLLLVALLLPSGLEDKNDIRNKKRFAEASSISFLMLFFFFILTSGIGILFFWGMRASDVFLLILTLAVPVIISSIIFYFVTVWGMDESVFKDRKRSSK